MVDENPAAAWSCRDLLMQRIYVCLEAQHSKRLLDLFKVLN